jgi:AcrR family transcriptional regulator
MKTAASRKHKVMRSSNRKDLKAQRAEEILAAAFEVFAAHGYEAARIDDVARQAGVAKGTIYLYFKTKDRLFQAVVRNLIPKRLDVLVKTLPGSSSDLLRGLLSQVYVNVVRNEKVRSIVRMLIAESGRFPQLADIYHQEIIVPGMKAVRQALTRGINAGEFGKTGALEFPQMVVAPALLAMVWQLLFARRHPLDMETYMRAHLEFVLSSLQKGRAQ